MAHRKYAYKRTPHSRRVGASNTNRRAVRRSYRMSQARHGLPSRPMLVKRVRNLERLHEKRYQEWSGAAVDINSTFGELFQLGGIAQGDAYNERQGQKMYPKTFFMSGEIQAEATDTSNFVRLMVIYRPESSTAPAISDIMSFYTTVQEKTHCKLRPKVPTQPYQILYDKTFLLTNNTVYAGGIYTKRVFIKLRMPKKCVQSYLISSTTLRTGWLGVCAVSDSASGLHPQLHHQSRFSWKDG